MIADEIPPRTEPEPALIKAANDNDGVQTIAIDPRFLVVARALGRHIAREQVAALETANDKKPGDAP